MSGMINVRIKEFDVGVSPVLIPSKQGMVLASDEFIVKSYAKEADERYNKLGIALNPFRSLEPKGEPKDMTPLDELLPPPPPVL